MTEGATSIMSKEMLHSILLFFWTLSKRQVPPVLVYCQTSSLTVNLLRAQHKSSYQTGNNLFQRSGMGS